MWASSASLQNPAEVELPPAPSPRTESLRVFGGQQSIVWQTEAYHATVHAGNVRFHQIDLSCRRRHTGMDLSTFSHVVKD